MSTADVARQSYAIRADSISEHCLRQVLGHSQFLGKDANALLEAQRIAARAFPYRAVGLHGRDPATVYVRQQVSASEIASVALAADPTRAVVAAESERLKPKTIEDALATHRHLFLSGEAGSGKSTLTLQLATRLVVLPGLRGAITLYPVRVLARDIAARPGMRLLSAVSEALRSSLARFLSRDLDPELLERPPHGGRWLLVIDGLDEVTAQADRSDLIERLQVFMEQEREYHVLVTSRPLPQAERQRWEEEKELTQYAIEPFHHDQRAQFAHAWFARDPRLADAFLAQLAAASFEEEASVPLLATVAAIVFEEDPEQPLPASRFDLYERYFAHLFDSRARQLLDDVQVRLVGRSQGEELARRLVESRVALIEYLAPRALRTESLLVEAMKWLASQGITPPLPPADWTEIVSSTLTSTGLLIPDGDGLRFAHHTFAEHICDLLDARRLPSRFDCRDAAWWRTLSLACTNGDASQKRVILHRALLSGDASELIDWLLEGGDTARELAAVLISRGVEATVGQHAALAETFEFWLWRAARAPQFVQQAVNALGVLRSLSRPLQRTLYRAGADQAFPEQLREACAQALLRSGDPHRSLGLNIMRLLLHDPQLAGRVRLRAAQGMQLAGETQAAVDGFRLLAQERGSMLPLHRQMAARQLAGSTDWSMSIVWPTGGVAGIDVRPPGGASTQGAEELRDTGAGMDLEEARGDAHGALEVGRGLDTPARAPSLHSPVPSDIQAFLRLGDNAGAEDVAAIAVAEAAALVANEGVHARRDRYWDYNWAQVAVWLCAEPAPEGSTHAHAVLALLKYIAELSNDSVKYPPNLLLDRPLRAVMAALLIRSTREHAMAGLRLLTGPIAAWNASVVRSLMQQAIRSVGDLHQVVIAQHCRILLDSRLPNTCRNTVLASVRGLNRGLAVELLSRTRGDDPYMVTSTMLRIGTQYHADAVAYLTEAAPTAFDGFLRSWCRAADELITCGTSEDRDETSRMVKRAAARVRDSGAKLALVDVLALREPMEAARLASAVTANAAASDEERLAAARLIAHVGHDEEYEAVAIQVMDALEARLPPAELIELAVSLARISPAATDRAETLLRACLLAAKGNSPFLGSFAAALARLGPDVRARLGQDLSSLVGAPSRHHRRGWFEQMETIAFLGPDMHEVIHACLTSHVHEGGGEDGSVRIAAADLIHTLDWKGSGVQGARLLSSLASSPSEHPTTRALAARRLRGFGPQYLETVLGTLRALAADSALPALFLIQVSRELAAAGSVELAVAVVAALVSKSSVPEPHRFEAALLMLTLDLACSDQTVDALAAMAGDRRLSRDTRMWAAQAPSLVRAAST
ncbi:NACHT domain-containing protein [Streptomyces sp. NPDC002054]|uniref:NACHT domain-containing protein n=1 Tax=Streptomyces sp. NPDC002054 TaxID=3154663 RepID=UPI003329C101